MTAEQINILLHKDVILEQLRQLNFPYPNEAALWLAQGFDIRPYYIINKERSVLKLVRQGLEKGLDMSIFLNTPFEFFRARQIVLGIEHEVDVSLYANNQFNSEQMYELRLGLEQGVDIRQYLNPDLTVNEMKRTRLKMRQQS